jgi:cation:H+ antiporter
MIASSFVLLGIALDGAISRFEGVGLLALLVLYTGWTLRASRRETAGESTSAGANAGGGVGRSVILVGVGLALLVVGARWFVLGATAAARALGGWARRSSR